MIAWYIVLILMIGCFVAGALVYRSNAKRLDAELAKLMKELDDLRAAARR